MVGGDVSEFRCIFSGAYDGGFVPPRNAEVVRAQAVFGYAVDSISAAETIGCDENPSDEKALVEEEKAKIAMGFSSRLTPVIDSAFFYTGIYSGRGVFAIYGSEGEDTRNIDAFSPRIWADKGTEGMHANTKSIQRYND